MGLRLYDNSRLSDAKACMRYYLLRHVYGWTAEGVAVPLVFGSSWHAAQDVIWSNHTKLYGEAPVRNAVIEEAYAAFLKEWTEGGLLHPDNMSPDDIDTYGARTPQIALEMAYGYIEARENLFTDPPFELMAVEEPFIIPLDPDDTTLWYVGRLDKKFRWKGKVRGLETKTTSLYRINGGFSADWIDSWSMDDQTDGYNFRLYTEYGKESGGVIIDGALVHKKVHDAFKLIPLEKQPNQLDAWLYDTRTWIDNIEANKAVLEERSKLDTPYLAAFPRNRRSCVGKFGKCQFFDLCRAHANPAKIRDEVPMGFKVEHWSPFDTLNLEKLGLDKESVAEGA